MGHVRDLPKSKLGVDVAHDFAPQYLIPARAKVTIKLLKEAAERSKEIWLSTDPDREGEAIAWHISQVLSSGQVQSQKSKVKSQKRIVKGSSNVELPTLNFQRAVFHEITEGAVKEAFENPRQLDLNLVNSQQARRILDRLVGYKLSPLLWKKVARNLSAGRVQSVAARLVVDRERERQNFVPKEYWKILASFKEGFEALLTEKNGQKISVDNESQAKEVKEQLEGSEFKINEVKKEEKRRYPAPPFTTSTLQQASGNKLGFSASRAMRAAQALYEKGLITYMRTDSVNLSAQFLAQAASFIKKEYGPNYAPASPIQYKTKARSAQEAHEAIRPTNLELRTQNSELSGDEGKIYSLVYKRALASQMVPAIFDATTIDVLAVSHQSLGNGNYLLRATGSVLNFDGWLKVYGVRELEAEEGSAKSLPRVAKDQSLNLEAVKSSQHFTEGPARYTEASLVKALEENGIGRPSTYAPIISTIQYRGYVGKEGRFLYPNEIGLVVNDLLVKHFPQIVDFGFTSRLEEELDEIAEGRQDYIKVLREFYQPFEKLIEEKQEEIKKDEVMTFEKLDETCPECGKDLAIKLGKFGKFVSCTGFPDCKYARPVTAGVAGLNFASQAVDESQLGKCPQDGGDLVVKRGRFGTFIACGNYPKCKFTKPYLNKVGLKCPECKEGEVVYKKARGGREFFGCSRYPDCKFASWKKPDPEKEAK